MRDPESHGSCAALISSYPILQGIGLRVAAATGHESALDLAMQLVTNTPGDLSHVASVDARSLFQEQLSLEC